MLRHNQKRKLKQEETIQWDESMLGGSKSGLVITRFGQHADIEDLESGEVQRCNLRRGIESLVSGDRGHLAPWPRIDGRHQWCC